MDNFNRVLELNTDLMDASGATNRGYARYMESVESSVNSAKAALEELWQSNLFPDLIKGAAGLATGFAKITEVATMPGLLIFAGVGALLKNEFAEAKALGIDAQFKAMGSAADKMTKSTTITGSAIKAASIEWDAYSHGMSVAKTNGEKLSISLQRVGSTANTMVGSLMEGAKGFLAAAGPTIAWQLALTGVVWIITKFISQAQKAKQEAIDMGTAMINASMGAKKNTDLLVESVEKYNEFRTKINDGSGSAKSSLSTAEYDEFLRLTETISGLLPETTARVDDYGDKILNVAESSSVATDQLKAYNQAQLEIFLNSTKFEKWKKSQIDGYKLLAEYRTRASATQSAGKRGDMLVDADALNINKLMKDADFAKEAKGYAEQISPMIEATANLSTTLEKSFFQTAEYVKAAAQGYEVAEAAAIKYAEAINSGEIKSIANAISGINEQRKAGKLTSDEAINKLKVQIALAEKLAETANAGGNTSASAAAQQIAQMAIEMASLIQKSEEAKVKVEELTSLEQMMNYENEVQKLSDAFQDVSDGSAMSVESALELAALYPEVNKYLTETGDLTFKNGAILKQIAEERRQTFVDEQKRQIALWKIEIERLKIYKDMLTTAIGISVLDIEGEASQGLKDDINYTAGDRAKKAKEELEDKIKAAERLMSLSKTSLETNFKPPEKKEEKKERIDILKQFDKLQQAYDDLIYKEDLLSKKQEISKKYTKEKVEAETDLNAKKILGQKYVSQEIHDAQTIIGMKVQEINKLKEIEKAAIKAGSKFGTYNAELGRIVAKNGLTEEQQEDIKKINDLLQANKQTQMDLTVEVYNSRKAYSELAHEVRIGYIEALKERAEKEKESVENMYEEIKEKMNEAVKAAENTHTELETKLTKENEGYQLQIDALELKNTLAEEANKLADLNADLEKEKLELIKEQDKYNRISNQRTVRKLKADGTGFDFFIDDKALKGQGEKVTEVKDKIAEKEKAILKETSDQADAAEKRRLEGLIKANETAIKNSQETVNALKQSAEDMAAKLDELAKKATKEQLATWGTFNTELTTKFSGTLSTVNNLIDGLKTLSHVDASINIETARDQVGVYDPKTDYSAKMNAIVAKGKLSDADVALVRQYGELRDQKIKAEKIKNVESTADWMKRNKVPTLHSGTPYVGMESLKADEVMAKLQVGEMVVPKNLNPFNSKSLTANSTSSSSPIIIHNLNLDNVQDVTTFIEELQKAVKLNK